MLTISIELVFNLTLLVALSIGSGFIEKRWSQRTRRGLMFQGILFGGAAVLGMLKPLDLGSGLLIDGRSVLVSLASLYFGPLAGSVAAVMTIACRLVLGGAGTFTGVLVIIASAGIGMLAHGRFRPAERIPSTRQLYLFGLAVHLVMLLLMFTLPGGVGPAVVARIGLPVLLLYPLATILVGKILSDQATTIRTLEDLQKARQNLMVTLQSIGDAVISTDLEGRVVFMNPVAEMLTGWSQAEACGRSQAEVFHIIGESSRKKVEDPVTKALRDGIVVGLANHTLLIAKDGSERPIADSAAPIRDPRGNLSGVVLVFRDQSEERRVQRLMQARLALMENSRTLGLAVFLTQALDEVCALLDSPLGFYHVVAADQKTLSLQQWSTRTLQDFCKVAGSKKHHDIDRAGAWADCVRHGQPVMLNEKADLSGWKNLPAGHAPMGRLMLVPVLREGRVVAVLGMGNKPADYTQTDLESVAFLADEIWQIVEEKRTAEQLRESDALFRNLFEDHAAAKLILDPDSGRIIDANQAAADYYGWSKQQLRQMKVQEINTLPAEEIAQELEKAKSRDKINFDFRHRRADGSVRDVRVFSSRIAVKGRNLLHSIVYDITERKSAEQALRASEERFRVLVENAPDAILVQTGGRFAYLNATAVRLFGAESAAGLVGTAVLDRFHPDMQEPVRERILALNQEKVNADMVRGICLRMDGSSVDVEASAVPMTYDGEDGALVFVRDISDRTNAEKAHRRLEQQLHQAQKIESVGRLAGGVAHDYNNMLGVIIGYADLALLKVDWSDPLRDDLDQILVAAKRSRDITRQLLAFARKQTLVPKVLDLNETIEGMLKMLRRLIGENIDLAWQPVNGLWPVEMDPSQLDQILANLCINARDAIGDVGKVTIETKMVAFDQAYCDDHPGFTPGDFVMLAVSDDGCGMNRETLEHIFEPFFTTKQPGSGTGLGLATVYGAIKQSNGFINVYSEPGQGAVFKIYLPRHAGQLAAESAPVVDDIIKGRGETVLLVEDEPLILTLTGTILDDLGYKVLAAESPAGALQLAEEFPDEIRLLITDVVMPEMNGRELAEQLQVLYPQLKCLFMSGYTANVIAHRGVLDKGIHFIQKPFSRNDLSRKIRTVLEESS